MKETDANVIGIIPAYKPDFKLTETLKKVNDQDFLYRIIVVDDGSGDEYQSLFSEIAQMPSVEVLHLGDNSGIGAAIKYGLQYSICKYPRAIGFVMFDADGQHAPEDVRHIVDVFHTQPDKLVLGIRDFHDPSLHIPLRSRFGNRVTEVVFYIFSGIHLRDTQTGLRCYPLAVAKKITQILRNRYEFPLEALLIAADMTDYVQVPIRTIYEDENKRSHFNPVLDSLRIYAVFFRFVGASFICSIVDYVVFALAFLHSDHVLLSLVFARLISISLNFVINKKKVFASTGNVTKELIRFFLLAGGLFAGSYYGIDFLKTHCGMNPLVSKILTEVVLFFISFIVQRFIVFARKKTT